LIRKLKAFAGAAKQQLAWIKFETTVSMLDEASAGALDFGVAVPAF
jgi:ABC-type nitrate/sulfonate/bicarbonate transport system substrate-binding protein